jgi:hypothetical protein
MAVSLIGRLTGTNCRCRGWLQHGAAFLSGAREALELELELELEKG